jgi:hypothetical protein
MTETASRRLCRPALVGEDLWEAQNTGPKAKSADGEVEWFSDERTATPMSARGREEWRGAWLVAGGEP